MRVLRLAAACLVLAPALAAGQERACGKAEAEAASKAAERSVGWPQLRKAWKDHRRCDSGEVGALFTDAVLRLAVEWKDVDAFAAEVAGDAEFKAFVYRHLRSPEAADDREDVYSRARGSCPARHAAFCAELADVVARPR